MVSSGGRRRRLRRRDQVRFDKPDERFDPNALRPRATSSAGYEVAETANRMTFNLVG